MRCIFCNSVTHDKTNCCHPSTRTVENHIMNRAVDMFNQQGSVRAWITTRSDYVEDLNNIFMNTLTVKDCKIGIEFLKKRTERRWRSETTKQKLVELLVKMTIYVFSMCFYDDYPENTDISVRAGDRTITRIPNVISQIPVVAQNIQPVFVVVDDEGETDEETELTLDEQLQQINENTTNIQERMHQQENIIQQFRQRQQELLFEHRLHQQQLQTLRLQEQQSILLGKEREIHIAIQSRIASLGGTIEMMFEENERHQICSRRINGMNIEQLASEHRERTVAYSLFLAQIPNMSLLEIMEVIRPVTRRQPVRTVTPRRASTNVHSYHVEKMENWTLKEGEDDNCAICYEELNVNNVAVLNCEHQFCRFCVKKCINKKMMNCSMCRVKITHVNVHEPLSF